MIRSAAVVGFCCLLAQPAGALDNEPFAPLPAVPDHVVTTVVRDIYPRGSEWQRVVTRHGTRSRIVSDRGPQRVTTYIDHERATALAFHPMQVSLHRLIPQPIAGSAPTGQEGELLGERCRIWTIPPEHPYVPGQRSCVTEDGIELWRRVDGQAEPFVKAIRLERRAVEPSDTVPDAGFLDAFRAMVRLGADPPTPGDVAVLELTPQSDRIRSLAVQRRVIRREPWLRVEDLYEDGTRLVEIQHSSGLFLRFQHGQGGAIVPGELSRGHGEIQWPIVPP